MLLAGMYFTLKRYRSDYPSVFSYLLLFCIALFWLFPFAAEKSMFLIKHDATGAGSVDYSAKDSFCHYKSPPSLNIEEKPKFYK